MPALLFMQQLSTHLTALYEVQMKAFGNMHPSSTGTEDCGTEDYREQIWPNVTVLAPEVGTLVK